MMNHSYFSLEFDNRFCAGKRHYMNKPNHYYKFLNDGELLLQKLSLYKVNSDAREGISIDSLESAEQLVKVKLRLAKQNKLPPKNQRYTEIARLVVDSWPIGTSLGNELASWENVYTLMDG